MIDFNSFISLTYRYLLGHTMHLEELSAFYPPAAALATQLGVTTTGFWHVALSVSPPNADDNPTHNHFSDQLVLQVLIVPSNAPLRHSQDLVCSHLFHSPQTSVYTRFLVSRGGRSAMPRKKLPIS